MSCKPIQAVESYEHFELDVHSQGWVRSVNHCFSDTTIVENHFQPGLYISILGRCQSQSLENSDSSIRDLSNHFTLALVDTSCLSRQCFIKGSDWQTVSLMIPLDQLNKHNIPMLSANKHPFTPKVKIAEHGMAPADILDCCQAIWSCSFTGFERELFIKAKAMEVLSLFLYKRKQGYISDACHQRLNRLKQALNHIKQDLSNDWNLNSIAQLAGSNRTYIKQDMKDLLGVSFREWLKDNRIDAATKRLSTQEPISEIAYGVGFKSQAHFATLFKNKVGMTPREYRQSLAIKNIA